MSKKALFGLAGVVGAAAVGGIAYGVTKYVKKNKNSDGCSCEECADDSAVADDDDEEDSVDEDLEAGKDEKEA